MAAFSLMRLFHGIGRLEEDDKTALTPAQAKAMLAIVTPLRKQPTLTPEQATRTRKQLEAQLTAAQQDAIAQAAPGRQGGRGGAGVAGANGPPRHEGAAEGQPGAAPGRDGQGGGWRPGAGPGGAGPGRRGAGMFAGGMDNFNPFYTSGDNPMAGRMAQRMQATFDALAAKAHR